MLRQETQTKLYGKPLVKPTQVEMELERIRLDAAKQDTEREQQSTGSAPARARATLANLVILNASANNERIDDAIDRLIDELCVSYPSRFFIVDANLATNASPNGIATAVSSRCFLTESGAHVCSEEVYVSVEDKAVPLVKNLLVSLFAPDVDVVLLVLGDIRLAEPRASYEALICALEPLCERVVYDSSSFEHFGRSLKMLTPAATPSSESKPELVFEKLSDLNWKRTRRWRALTAEGFDAERLTHGDVVVKEAILHCQCSADELRNGKIPADVLLYSGWLCSSLGSSNVRRIDESNEVLFEAVSSGLKLKFLGESDPKWNLCDARLLAVEILAETGDAKAVLKIERTLSRKTAEISIGFSEKTEGAHSSCEFTARNAPFIAPPLDELILSHIVSRRDDPHYLRTLEVALKLSEG